MLRLLGLILLAFPALELIATISLAMMIGAWIWVVLAAGVVSGILLLRGQKAAFPLMVLKAAQQGRNPLTGLLWSGRMAVAGVLLIVPGVLSDLLALIILLPWTPKMAHPAGMATPQEELIIEGEFQRVNEVHDRLP